MPVRRQRLRLRPFGPEDAEAYRQIINDPEIGRRIDRGPRPIERGEHRRWYKALVSSPSVRAFSVERRAGRQFLGLVWLFDIHWRHRRAEVRIVLGPPSGKGYGPEALRLVVREAFGRLGIEKLWADVLTLNRPARSAFEKAGFRLEGKLRGDRVSGGQRVDVWRLGLLRGEPKARRRGHPTE